MEDIIKAERVRVFIPDDDLVWISADIVQEVKPGHYEIEIDDPDHPATKPRKRIITMRTLCRPLDSLPLQNEGMTSEGVDDMCLLNYLHEPGILDNLRRRHHSYLPYTYTGEICIAINPYQWLDIYTTDLMEKHATNLRHELSPPHVYATSAAAYRGLKDYNRNQSILVSGESGAGKTETVKILMGHIAHISGRHNMTIIDKVLKANPLLESFGNAKTSRNDNSSRFGKFTRLQFDKYATLAGSRCVTYLLEKSRVIIQQNREERNYHIFHQLFAAPESVKSSLHLGGKRCSDFRYTGSGDVITSTIEGVPDGERFDQTFQILQLLGVDDNTRSDLQRILAGIVFLGQVPFLGDADDSFVDPAARDEATKCCELLGLQLSAFEKDTTVRKIVTSEESLLVKLSREQASDGRDALAKDIYDRLFQWLVVSINDSTAAHQLERDRAYHGSEGIIALLDIFGFESFQVNRFEQLCINYANEKLQQKFTQDVFMAVQEEYKSEGLEWELIGYKDNADVLDLLEGRLGIMALLNEECLVPRGNDASFFTKIFQNNNKHPCFSAGTLDIRKDEFRVFHYAGKVVYCSAGFVELNRDAIPSELRQLMLTSTNALVNKIFKADADALKALDSQKGGRNKQSFMKADTVTTKFRTQLTSLMETISKTTVQYVRCIKPNAEKSKDVFNRLMVVEQLRCAGMIEAIRISRAAYPYRITHYEFATRFGGLRSPSWMKRQGAKTDEAKCRALLEDIMLNLTDAERDHLAVKGEAGLSDKPFEIGKTRVYFSAGVLELLESKRGQLVFIHIKCIQRFWRGYRQRLNYQNIKIGAALVKRVLRGWKHKKRFMMLRRAVIALQCAVRRRIARRKVMILRTHKSCVRLQSWGRMVPRRRAFIQLRVAAVIVGRWLKSKLHRKHYKRTLATHKENAKLSNQLDALKVRLSEAAVEKEAAEKAAQEQLERERQLLELERREAQAAAELEKQRIMEEAQRALEAEKRKLLEEQEKFRVESLKLAQAQANSENEEKKAQELQNLQMELTKMREAQVAAEIETEKIREEARKSLEIEREKLRSEQESLKQEIIAEAQRNEKIVQQQAHDRMMKYHEREREELLALEGLQSELSRLREKNDQLLSENSELKSQLRKESVTADFRSGEIAVVKVQLEAIMKDRDHVIVERDRAQRMMRQYKVEKGHVMEALLELSKELDDAHRVQQELYKDVLNEQRARESQRVQTVSLLRSRGVNRAIIEDLRHVVYGLEYEDDDGSEDGSRHGSEIFSPTITPRKAFESHLRTPVDPSSMSPHKGGLKSREQARRKKQGFSLHRTSDRSKGGQESEGSIISSLPDSSSAADQNIYSSQSNHGIAENYHATNGSGIVLESLDNASQHQYQHQYQTQQTPPPLPPSAPQQQQQQNQASGSNWFGIF